MKKKIILSRKAEIQTFSSFFVKVFEHLRKHYSYCAKPSTESSESGTR